MTSETQETTTKNWQSLPKHARVSDYKDIISPHYKSQYSQFAFRVLKGPAYKYSTVLEFILDFLERRGDWIRETDLRKEASNAMYHPIVIASALNRLKELTNIELRSEVGHVYYKWNDQHRERDAEGSHRVPHTEALFPLAQ